MSSFNTTVKTVGYTRIFTETRNAKTPVIINVGGARSSKSYSIAQVLIEKLVTEREKKILITRKTFPALRMSTMLMFIDLLKDYRLYDEDKHNKTFSTLEVNGNTVQFAGLDEPEKIKSTEFNYIWMEEGNEFYYEDYTALKLRLSGGCLPGELNHLYISLNPIDANNWIATKAAKEFDVTVIKSTYLDNPFLSESYKRLLTDLINQDEQAYRVYVLGEWGLLEGKIYSNYQVIPELPKFTDAKWAYGLDFGDACSALVKVYLWRDTFYLEERFYKSGWTNSDIIEFLSHEERGDIYGDPSAKQQIKEIQQAGYFAFEGIRDVKASIDLCKRQKVLIPQSSVNIIREIQNYHRKRNPLAIGETDKFLDEPVKYNDHTCDSWRYAVWGITSRFGFPTQRPRATEPIKSLTFGDQNPNDKLIERLINRNAN